MAVDYSYTVKLNARFGFGVCRNIGEYLESSGFKKIGFIIDTGVFNSEPVEAMIRSAKTHCSVQMIYECRISEPTYDELDSVAAEFRGTDFDAIVGVGGGSVMDIAKGVCVLLKNPGKGIEYRGFDLMKNDPVAMVAVPTTAGTGSEVTPNAVFTDTKEQRKFGINGDKMFAKMAFLDPELTLDCPKKVTISSGMDALVHSLESFASKRATPFSKIFSIEAFKLISKSLPGIIDDPKNPELRSKMLLGSHFAGIALFNSSAGPAGAMSYPLGVLFKVPHGIAGAVFLPKVVRKNIEMGYIGYGELYDYIETSDKTLSMNEKATLFCDWLESLCIKLEIPEKLGNFGVKPSDIDKLLQFTVGGLKPALDNNPVDFGEKELREVLEKMF